MCQEDHIIRSRNRSAKGAFAFRPTAARMRRAGFVRTCLLLTLLAACLPASLAGAQALEGNAAETAASPEAAIWSLYPIYGGNMEALVSDPNNSQVFYAGTESAGVFKATDAGSTWQPARSGLPPTAKVISLAVDPQNSNSLYAGTDEVGIIWKSQDAGATWTNITHNMETGTFADAYLPYNIVVDPNNSNTVYVGLGGYAGQIYKTTDGGAIWWVMDNGIPRDDDTYTDEITALAIDPTQSSVLYAGVRKDGVYKTIDGGANWTPLNEGVPFYRDEYKEVTALAVDHLHDNRPAGIIDGKYYVFGTDNKWSLVSTGYGINSSWEHAHLVFHPTDTNIIYSAGDQLTKSSDGGITWVSISGDSYSWGHPDMAFHRSAPNALLAANQVTYGDRAAGVRKSLNGGVNWIDASSGIAAHPIQGVAIDPQNANNLYAGRSEGYSGVWRSTNRGVTWDYTATDGQIQDIVVDPLDSMKVYAAADYYFMVSNDQGVSFTVIEDVNATCLAVTPGASNPVYAGGRDGVYKSIDGGLTWVPKDSTFPTNSSGDPAQVMSLAVDPNNTAIVWAGTAVEGLVRSPDGGESWQYKGFLDMPDVDAVAVRPGDSNTILVGTGDYRGSGGRTGGIYKSTDGGQTWQPKQLGASTITDFVFDPRNPDWVYAGTGYVPSYGPGGTEGIGVLRSVDGGEHWSVYSSGLFNQVVFSLAISSEESPLLLAGTMGSGLYGTQPSQPPPMRRFYVPLIAK